MRAERAPGLDRVLAPTSIAVVGASRDPSKLGGKVLANLELGFRGQLYAVNPAGGPGGETGRVVWCTEVDRLPAVDLLVLAIPARAVAELVSSGGVPAGTGGLAVLADETSGTDARARFDRLLGAFAASSGVRVLGPNSSGFRSYGDGLFVTFAGDVDASVVGRAAWRDPAVRRAGAVSLVSPSGAMMAYLGGTLLARRAVGLDYVIDTGNEVDIDTAECLSFLAARGARRIGMVVEGTHDWKRFRSRLAGAAGAGVDVVALQVGRSASGRAISATHTGAVGGTAGAFRAVVAAAGATPVLDEAELLDALTLGPDLVRGRSRTVLLGSFSGGMNALMVDQLADALIDVPALDQDGAVANPMDFGPGALRDVTPIEQLMGCAARAPGLGATVLFTGHVTQMAQVGPRVMQVIEDGAARVRHPVLVVGKAPEGWYRPDLPHLVVVDEPRSAVRALAHAFGPGDQPSPVPAAAATGERAMTWSDAEQLLRAAGVEVAPTQVVATPDAAAKAADDLGLPVVLKADAPALLHRARLGLVALGVADRVDAASTFTRLLATADAAGVAEASVLVQAMVPADVELFVGATYDDAFGPTVTLGLGGGDVEAAGRPRPQLPVPVDPDRCRRALETVGVAPTEPLIDAVARIAAIGLDLPGATVVEVNPLRVSATHPGGVAVDCVILQSPPAGTSPEGVSQ